jgi:hypothetical protein
VLRDRPAATALLIANLCSALIGGFQLLPVFLQLARRMRPRDVGLLVMFRPAMGATVCARAVIASLCPQLSRHGDSITLRVRV